ncbi:HAD hydrolase-like protein [Bacteroidota bacterium]
MKNKKVILFDLDGTLTNSAPGIFNSLRYALRKFSIETIPQPVLESFIGPSLKYSFSKHFFIDEKDVFKAIKYYREYYVDKGMFENKLYNGIEDLLFELKKKDKILNIASSKPSVYVTKILQYFKILHYFDHAVGAKIDGSHSDKVELINENLALYPQLRKKDFVIIGDRNWDIIGAKKAEIDSIGVKYGFAEENELEEAGATIVVNSVNELQDILL